jgi:hypothetical protein
MQLGSDERGGRVNHLFTIPAETCRLIIFMVKK